MAAGSDESTKDMPVNINRQRVLNFLAALYGGDAEAAMKCCTDDVLLMIYLPVELFPHLGPRRGRKAVADLMEVHEARYSRRHHEVRFVVADSQRAAAIVDVTYTKRVDGRVIQLASGDFFLFRRGLIAEIRSFFDTIDMVSQLMGRDLVGPLLRETGTALRPPKRLPHEPAQ